MNPALEFIVYMIRAVILVLVMAFFAYFIGMVIIEHMSEKRRRLGAIMRKRATNKRWWLCRE